MKKVLLLALLMLSLVLCFVACDGPAEPPVGGETPPEDETPPCSHQFAEAYTSDEENHWFACSLCDAKKDVAAHAWGEAQTVKAASCREAGEEKYVCTVCENEKTVTLPLLPHTYAEEASYNDTHHWYAFTCGCEGEGKDYAEHTLVDNACACGYTKITYTEGLTYKLTNKDTEYWVTGLGTAKGYIIIPETHNGKPVVGIDTKAFKGKKTVTGVLIPATVRAINSEAFMNCTNLERVDLAENTALKQIAPSSFQNTKLTSFHVPATVTWIGEMAFAAEGFEEFTVDPANTTYTAIDGCLCTKDGKKLVHYAYGKKAMPFVVPAGITTLDYKSFTGCQTITDIVISRDVEIIGLLVFMECPNLKNVTFEADSKLQTIGMWAFRECTALEAITFPASLKRLGYDPLNSYATYGMVFKGCTSLKSVVFEDNSQIEYIDKECFSGCAALETVDFGKNSQLDRIGVSAFSGCFKLSEIRLPEHLTVLGGFNNCGVKSMVIPKSVTRILSIKSDYLETIYYGGTQSEWNAISGLGSYLSKVNIVYNYSE